MADTKKNSTTTLLYVYTSTPLQQYQYVPKETVRHQGSCEEVRRASQGVTCTAVQQEQQWCLRTYLVEFKSLRNAIYYCLSLIHI